MHIKYHIPLNTSYTGLYTMARLITLLIVRVLGKEIARMTPPVIALIMGYAKAEMIHPLLEGILGYTMSSMKDPFNRSYTGLYYGEYNTPLISLCCTK